MHNLCILNTGEPTRRTRANENLSAVDLSLCSPGLASSISWRPLSSSFGSDHFPLLMSVPIGNTNNTTRKPRLKYLLNNANWDKFKEKVDLRIKDLPESQAGNEEICSEYLAKILIEAADETFRHKSDKSFKVPTPPWWDKECSDAVKERKRMERIYENDMSDVNFENLSQNINFTRSLLKKKKQEGWKSFCSSLSPDTCSSEVWKNIRRFRSAFREQTSVISEELAHKFMDNLAPSTAPEYIGKSLPIISPTDHDYSSLIVSPFVLEELKGVLSCVKDSAPAETFQTGNS
ncbi:unnamed protein product [Colias eurytheme]|nr:unnamed protein product [Colias eurytheme]